MKNQIVKVKQILTAFQIAGLILSQNIFAAEITMVSHQPVAVISPDQTKTANIAAAIPADNLQDKPLSAALLPLPQGTTRARSNPDFAFLNHVSAVRGIYVYDKILIDLRTGAHLAVAGAGQICDVSADGRYVISGDNNSDYNKVYIQSIEHPADVKSLEGRLEQIQFSGNSILLQTKAEPIGANYTVDYDSLNVTLTVYRTSLDQKGITYNAEAGAVIHADGKGKFSFYDASKGLNQMQFINQAQVQTTERIFWAKVEFVWNQTYNASGQKILEVSVKANGIDYADVKARNTFVLNLSTKQMLKLDGVIQSVGRNGRFVDYSLNRSALFGVVNPGAERNIWIDLQTMTIVENMSPDIQKVIERCAQPGAVCNVVYDQTGVRARIGKIEERLSLGIWKDTYFIFTNGKKIKSEVVIRW